MSEIKENNKAFNSSGVDIGEGYNKKGYDSYQNVIIFFQRSIEVYQITGSSFDRKKSIYISN